MSKARDLPCMPDGDPCVIYGLLISGFLVDVREAVRSVAYARYGLMHTTRVSYRSTILNTRGANMCPQCPLLCFWTWSA